jgi:hypothetical protein
MTLKEKLEKIEELQKLTTPWKVMRLMGKVELFGNHISFNADGHGGDFVSLEEAREAIDWLVEQLGGQVKWRAKK